MTIVVQVCSQSRAEERATEQHIAADVTHESAICCVKCFHIPFSRPFVFLGRDTFAETQKKEKISYLMITKRDIYVDYIKILLFNFLCINKNVYVGL